MPRRALASILSLTLAAASCPGALAADLRDGLGARPPASTLPALRLPSPISVPALAPVPDHGLSSAPAFPAAPPATRALPLDAVPTLGRLTRAVPPALRLAPRVSRLAAALSPELGRSAEVSRAPASEAFGVGERLQRLISREAAGNDAAEAVQGGPELFGRETFDGRAVPLSARSGLDVPPPPAARAAVPGERAYLWGTLASQIGNNALIVALPLALLRLGQPLAAIGVVTAQLTLFDMSGTLLGGRLSDRHDPRAVLAGATALRGALLLAAAGLLSAGRLSVAPAFGLYALDALARGVTDTARATLPVLLVGKVKAALDDLNSRYEMSFHLGGVVGPALAGAVFASGGLAAANGLIAASFAAAVAAYLAMPSAAPASKSSEAGASSAARGGAWRDPWMKLALAASVLLALHPPLKGVLPAFFAEGVLLAPGAAASLVALFSLGAFAGAFLYKRGHARHGLAVWLAGGAAGTLVLAVGWIPGSLAAMGAAAFVFSLAYTAARLAVLSAIQERLPDGKAGGVMGTVRFSANLTSVIARYTAGQAFLLQPPTRALTAVGAALAVLAAALFWIRVRLAPPSALAGRLSADASEPPTAAPARAGHGLPGLLIVFEGPDGAGKTSQIEKLKACLEARGLPVLTTAWNSSSLVAAVIKAAKKARSLSPRMGALLQASDWDHRLESLILPALRKGWIVLADRNETTSRARDKVRGLQEGWLSGLYAFAPRPDVVLYFKLPVEQAIARVLARNEGRLGLSEDHADGESAVKHYEAGLDLRLSNDPLENFRLFQARVVAEYEAMAAAEGFRVIDAARDREAQHAAVLGEVAGLLGPLETLHRAPASPPSNLFDRDPAADDAELRREFARHGRGAQFFFRKALKPMRRRFTQLLDVSSMPAVFLHGNPNLANYAKSARGAAMVDFDRSVDGPYAWDLARFLGSLSLQRKSPHGFLGRETATRLRQGYLRGFAAPQRPFDEPRSLRDLPPEKGEKDADHYLNENMKWAKAMREHPLPADDPEVRGLLRAYADARLEPELLARYRVEEAGRGLGSMGNDRVLIVLAPLRSHHGKGRVLLEFKGTYPEPDDGPFKNPFDHQGRRMVEASNLYAPGWDERQAGVTWQGREYWAHAIPSQNVKLKKPMDDDEQADVAYAVGTQLGRAHRLSLRGGRPEALTGHLNANWERIVAAAEIMHAELLAARERYLERLRSLDAAAYAAGGRDDD